MNFRECTLAVALILVTVASAQEAEKLEVAPVERGHFVTTVRVTGKIVPREGAMFVQGARVAGRVLSILKREGEHVTHGTPIFRVSSAECASLSEETRVANERSLAELKEAVHRRQARLELKLSGEDCLILATASGTITKRFVEPGANFNLGDPLAHLVDPQRVAVEVEIPEKDVARIGIGKKVTVRLASDSENEYVSTLQTMVPSVDPATRTAKGRLAPIQFKNVPTIESFVSAEIETDSPEQTLIVPSAALVFHQGKQWVLAVGPENKLSPVAVDVVSDSGSKSAVRPIAGQPLAVGQNVMTKGAVFAFKHLRSERN